jgi:general secretion pathway protein G
MSYKKQRTLNRAFSLVEVMIVIVIIGMLAGVVTVNVRSYIDKARKNTAKQEIATIVAAIETFYSITSRYPTNDEGLDVLVTSSDTFPEPPLKKLPRDPWGNEYAYRCPGSVGDFEVVSFGKLGREGGTGTEADLSSDTLDEQ